MALCRFAIPPTPCLQILRKQSVLSSSSPSSSSSRYYPLTFRKVAVRANLKLRAASISYRSYSFTTMEASPEGYRRNVGICLLNSSKKIFAASRLDIPGSWQMPQGGIDESEDPRDAAIRELREETGVRSAEIIAEVPYWLTYDFPPGVRERLKNQWGTDWKGQAKKWFLLKLTGSEEEINLLGDGTEKAEFGEWSWMSPEQVIERIVDFKKPIYRDILSVFNPHLH